MIVMPKINIIGELPTAAPVYHTPPSICWNLVRSPRDGVAYMKISGNSWMRDDRKNTAAIPGEAAKLAFLFEGEAPYVPIVLPPAGSLPLLEQVNFYGLPIASMTEIGNLDAYQPQLREIGFNCCCSLVIDDLSWFASMPLVERIHLPRCKLQSIRCFDQLPKNIKLSIKDNKIDLAEEIGIIESHWKKHGSKVQKSGKIEILGNCIGREPIKKQHFLTTSSTITYIHQWMAKLGTAAIVLH